MKLAIKKTVFATSLIIIAPLVYGGYQLVTRWGYLDDVKQICKTQKGASIDDVYEEALKIGFRNIRDNALPYEIMLRGGSGNSGEAIDLFSIEKFRSNDQGELTFGRVIFPPFLRSYCKFEYVNRRVINSRLWMLD